MTRNVSRFVADFHLDNYRIVKVVFTPREGVRGLAPLGSLPLISVGGGGALYMMGLAV